MKVAIIGAGITGLTTARELTQHGVDVDVFEKARGLGGRLATKRLDWGNIDIGAQYFTARDHRFQQQLKQWQEAGIVDCWRFTPHKLTPSGLTASPDKEIRYVGTPRMNSLAHGLARNLNINLNVRIEHLKQDERGWHLITDHNKLIKDSYDWVVLTTPLEQSKPLTKGTSLYHQLPDSIHQPCWALALATIGLVAENIEGIFGDDLVSWTSRLSSRPQRETPPHYDDIWMLHFSGKWSANHDKRSDSNLVQTGLKWLSNTLSEHTVQPLQLVHSHQHFWRYASVDDSQRPPFTTIDKTNCLAAIGAWSAGGRVEGAYISALDFVDHFFDIN